MTTPGRRISGILIVAGVLVTLAILSVTGNAQPGKSKRQAPRDQRAARQSQAAVFSTDVPAHPFDLILGRPTREAITLR